MPRERPSVSAGAGRQPRAGDPGPAPRTGEVPPGEEHGPEPNTLVIANPALRGGFVQLPVTVLETPGLSRDAKLLYAILLRYAWQAGSCFPGYTALQATMECAPNSLTRYMGELERFGLITRQRRGLGRTNVYTLHDLPTPPRKKAPAAGAAPPAAGGRLIRKKSESGSIALATPLSPGLRHESDSGESDSAEHHHGAGTSATPHAPAGALDDALVASLEGRGLTPRVARQLATTHDAQAIRDQLAWLPYRPKPANPAGALVQAIRERWPAPPAWREAQEHAAAVARQAEEERRRQEEEEAHRRAWAAKPPEERIAGRLQFWIQRRRLKGQAPDEAEIAAHRAQLLAELAGAGPGATSSAG